MGAWVSEHTQQSALDDVIEEVWGLQLLSFTHYPVVFRLFRTCLFFGYSGVASLTAAARASLAAAQPHHRPPRD